MFGASHHVRMARNGVRTPASCLTGPRRALDLDLAALALAHQGVVVLAPVRHAVRLGICAATDFQPSNRPLPPHPLFRLHICKRAGALHLIGARSHLPAEVRQCCRTARPRSPPEVVPHLLVAAVCETPCRHEEAVWACSAHTHTHNLNTSHHIAAQISEFALHDDTTNRRPLAHRAFSPPQFPPPPLCCPSSSASWPDRPCALPLP